MDNNSQLVFRRGDTHAKKFVYSRMFFCKCFGVWKGSMSETMENNPQGIGNIRWEKIEKKNDDDDKCYQKCDKSCIFVPFFSFPLWETPLTRDVSICDRFENVPLLDIWWDGFHNFLIMLFRILCTSLQWIKKSFLTVSFFATSILVDHYMARRGRARHNNHEHTLPRCLKFIWRQRIWKNLNKHNFETGGEAHRL